MKSEENKQFTKSTSKKEKNNPLKHKYIEDKKIKEDKEKEKICMTYKIDGESFDDYIRLFGRDFVKRNKDKCKIIISGKKYEIKDKVCFEEYEKYGINKNDETFEVILKGEELENLSDMFCGCENLIKVNFTSFNTQNITGMSSMFCGCANLIKVDLSTFNTRNIRDMSYLFSGCENLTEVDISSFNTENVINMSNMFSGCEKLIEVDLSSFNSRNVTDMSNMFSYCYNLIEVDLSSFNTRNVTDMSWMFYGCQCLIKINRKKCNKIIKDFRHIKSKLFIIEV